MKKTNRVILSFIAIALICACVIFMLAACNFNQQQSVPNNSNGNNTSNNNTSDNNANNDTNTDNNNQPSNPVDPEKPDPEKPDKPVTPPEEQISEAEYKAMFEEKLPTVIEEYFNENLAEKERRKISNVNIKAYNNFDGSVYFSCKQNGGSVFLSINSKDLAGSSSYKDLNEKMSKCVYNADNIIGVISQDQALADEIAAFALEQQEVKDYIKTNGINPTELEVLNATHFETASNGNFTNLIFKSKNTIFSVKMGGVTGACSSQEEYLSKLQNGRLKYVEISDATKFEELAVKDDANAASVYEVTLPEGVGDFLFNQTYYTENGDIFSAK